MYDSGDWDVDQRMPSNLLDSLIEYTTPARRSGGAGAARSPTRACSTAPFCYLAGHKLVEFNPDERRNFERYVRQRRLRASSTTATTTSTACSPSRSRREMAAIFGADALRKLPNDAPALLAASSSFDGPPATGVRAERLGRRSGARLPARASRSTAASACSTATRTTAASGTTTGATSAGWPRTTPSSRVNIVIYALTVMRSRRERRR